MHQSSQNRELSSNMLATIHFCIVKRTYEERHVSLFSQTNKKNNNKSGCWVGFTEADTAWRPSRGTLEYKNKRTKLGEISLMSATSNAKRDFNAALSFHAQHSWESDSPPQWKATFLFSYAQRAYCTGNPQRCAVKTLRRHIESKQKSKVTQPPFISRLSHSWLLAPTSTQLTAAPQSTCANLERLVVNETNRHPCWEALCLQPLSKIGCHCIKLSTC